MTTSNIDRRDLLKYAAVSTVALPTLMSGCATGAGATQSPMLSANKHSGYFDGPEGQLHYWVAGRGPNLLLVHQSNNSGEEYSRLVPYLSKRFRMIVIDLPGHGNSDDPAGAHEVDKLSAAVVALADHLDLGPSHILGHHGGALVAMNLVRLHPQRVMNTILSGSSGPKTPQEAEEFKNAILSRAKPFDWAGESLANTWDRYVALKSDDARIEDLVASFLITTKTKLRPHNVYQAFLNWDRSSSLDALTGPVLLMQGDKDIFVSHQERLLEIIPDSKRAVLPGCGAFMFYERPEACAKAIQAFLA